MDERGGEIELIGQIPPVELVPTTEIREAAENSIHSISSLNRPLSLFA